MTGARPSRGWLLAHLALLAAAAVVLVVANRGQWFFGDEWEFLVNRGFAGAPASLWYPHNEHWSTLPILVYTALRNAVGLASYWPFVGVLIGVHLALTHLLWRVMLRSGALPLVATVAAAVFSVLGAGAENLLWAFQIGFVGAVALGWAAALVASAPGRRPGRRDAWTVLLLVGALMCSGIGVPMVVVATVAAWAASRALWRPLVAGGVPAVVFVAWYALVGRTAPKQPGTQERSPREVATLLRDGFGSMAGQAIGTPRVVTAAVLVVLGLWCLWAAVRAVRGGPDAAGLGLALAGVVGIAAFGVMVSVGRGTLGASRYVYIVVALALPVVAVALSTLCRWRWVEAVVVAALVAVGAHNVLALRTAVANEAAREGWTREVIESAAALAADDEPTLLSRPEPVYDPDITVESLRTFVGRNHLPAAATERGTAAVRLALEVAPVSPGAVPQSTPARVADRGGLVPAEDAPQCLTAAGTDEPGAVSVTPDGAVHSLWLRAGDDASYVVGLGGGPSAPPARTVSVPEGGVVELVMDLPAGSPDLTVGPQTAGGLVCLEP